MPSSAGPSNSPSQNVSPLPVKSVTLTFGGGGGTQSTDPVHADGLPGLRAWFLQTAGAGVVSVQLEFADGNAANNTVLWAPLVPAFGIALGVPSLTPYSLGSRLYRATVTSTGVAVVRTRLNAALT